MYQKYKKDLYQDQLRVFEMLEKLKQDERLSGPIIKSRTSFGQRRLTEVIEGIRSQGLPIISTKSGTNSGYKIAANQQELNEYISTSFKTIQTQIDTLNAMATFFENLEKEEQNNG